jgi:hypothetical protein
VDIFLAVAIFLVTSATAYLGVRVTLHPAETPEAKRRYKIGFGVLTLAAAGLITWQSVLNRRETSELHAQLNRIQHNTEQASPSAIIQAIPVTKPFRRTDGRVQVNLLARNMGNRNVQVSWSSKLWVFWDSEVPKEPKAQREFEDKLWKQLEADPQRNALTVSISMDQPQLVTSIGEKVFSEDDFRAIEQAQQLVYLMSIARYPDNHETPFCGLYWSPDKGNYEACRDHNVPH